MVNKAQIIVFASITDLFVIFAKRMQQCITSVIITRNIVIFVDKRLNVEATLVK